MKWVSTKDIVPQDGEEVLIQLSDNYTLAIYDASNKLFKIKKDDKQAKTEQLVIYWTRLVKPESLHQ